MKEKTLVSSRLPKRMPHASDSSRSVALRQI
jgi:hypothetical protein